MPRSLPRARRGLPRAALLLGLLAALTAAFQLTERTTSAADFCAAPTFGPATTYPVGRARGMAVGDFNGDGLNDLAVTDNFVAGKVSVLLGKPGGTFGPAAHFTTGRNPWSVAVGDFNGDSKSDLATANFNDFEGDATTLAGNGAGGFGPAVNHFLTSPGSSANSPAVAAADFNLDGKTDLAVANMTHHAVVFMFGLGDGTFGSVKFVGVGGFLSPIHVVVADFNKDGKPDVATANNTAQNVSVLLGDGAGNFVAPALFNVGHAPPTLAAADFNGDNNPDLAVANQGSNTVSVLRGDGAGGFSTGGQFATGGTNPTSVASADFNGDGHTDLAVTNFMENNVVVLRGDGAGSFTPTASFDTGGRETQFVVAADFNGDGEPDLAAANELSRNVSVLLNTCGSAAATSTVQFEAATYFAFENQDPLRFQVAVTRTGDITAAATVEYSTSALTATPGADYTETSGTFNFAPGETRKVFNVPVSDDNLDEADETVRLQLTNASGATLGTSSATATVLDNDAAPSVSVGDVSVNEGDAGTTAAVFTVSLSAPSGKTVTVGINNADGTAVGGGNDYFHYPGPYTLTFTPGQTQQTATIAVIGDTNIEPDETFFMNLSAPVNATLGDAQGLGTILNDDAAPTVSLSLNDVSVAEGNSGTTDAVFTATLSGTTTKTVTVDVLTISESASVGSDFQSSFKTLTFAPGQTSQTFAVPVIGDALFEGNETFRVEFRNPVNATVADGAGVGTILDDDASPTVSVDDVTVTEDDGGTGSAVRAVFTVSLSSATSGQVVVGYTVASGSAVEGEDFLGVGGALMFGPGTTKQTISVPVVGDTIAEAEEQFFVNLTPMDNAVIVKSKGTGTILDDDQNKPTPFVQFDVRDRAVSEGVGFVVVNVTRSGDASKAVSVLYSTNVDNNSRAASERDDYTIALGRLDFAPGETSKSFNVLITDDSRAEREEFITLTLADPTGGAVLGNPALALLRITDNDQTDGKNPIENPEFFVRQHYRDFFTREPDAAGLGFWTNQIAECGADAACRDIRRTNVSAAFFLSIEFQETGFLAYRLHQAAFDTGEHLALRPFMFDSQQIGRGVVIGQPGADAQLEANKQAFVAEFVTRPQFAAQYPATLTPAQFVDALNANTGGALTQAERDDLVNRLAAGQLTRAQVLRAVAENAEFARRQLRRAFVYMQYVGYLRRAPDQAGFDFWLGKLNDHKGDYISSEMIRSFLVSGEYIERFGP